MRSAQGGLQGQFGGGFAWQAKLFASGGHGFDQQEEVRRAAAGDGGDCIELLFAVQPQGNAHRRQQLLSLLALRCGDFGSSV
ncbi:hypothetical protein D3C79_955210 [compost metagenome]